MTFYFSYSKIFVSSMAKCHFLLAILLAQYSMLRNTTLHHSF